MKRVCAYTAAVCVCVVVFVNDAKIVNATKLCYTIDVMYTFCRGRQFSLNQSGLKRKQLEFASVLFLRNPT